MNPLTLLLSFGTTLIERLFPDPAQAAEAKLKLLEMQNSGELATMTAQTDINKAEASSGNWFASSWRPLIGYICGLACAWNWVGLPVAKFGLAIFGVHVDITPADISQMLPILMGMLGLGSLRTVEKMGGVATK